MYQKTDGRSWSRIEIYGVEIEMLWDSGASVTVMSERLWNKIGAPSLNVSGMRLCGVFSMKAERPLGCTTVEAIWKNKRRKIEVTVVKNIRPEFIGGINVMTSFGIKLIDVNNIDAVLVNQSYTDLARVQKALECAGKEQNEEIIQMIKKFGCIFMASKFDLGFTKLVRHEMITKGGPIMQPPRRQPMHMEKKIEDLLKELMKANVIRKCTSAWNAPLVIVGKKDGSIRMCVDYRGLNNITEKESFPMPNTRFLLDCLADAKYFSSIDLGQAYYQVELEPTIQERTAFSTREGQYCFNRLPFGLSTAPATFQRLMHVLFKDLIFKGLVVYLDDILIYGKTLEEHNQRLAEVFTRIKEAGLKINPEKCEFGKKELSFLGHTVNERGVQTNKKKIEEIEKAIPPTCSKQLRSFLGLTNYYRRFIKDYAKIAAPLHAATSGCEKDINWSEACNESFQTLKKKLCEAPILDYPREDRLFILDTDASFGAIGAVLSQIKENEEETVIAYGSRHLTMHEKGYCVTRKELLAIHEYVSYFKEYLYGKKFIIRTDHKALVFMNTTKKAISPQFQTWLANLSEYDYELKYRKGDEHGNADGLSRINCTLCSQCQTRHMDAKAEKTRIRHIFTIGKTEAMDELFKEQSKDRDFLELKEWIENKSHIPRVQNGGYPFMLKEQVKIIDGLLTIEKERNELILVPMTFTNALVNKMHIELCHVGIKKLLQYMKDIFFWPNMQKSIQISVGECEYCAKRKINQSRTKEIFIPRESSEFLEQLVIDVAYMEETSGKKYVLVVIDRFSKLISLTALAKQDEETIFKTLLHKWIYRFGKPRSILSDRGRNFESKYLKENLGIFGIKQEFTSPYQHQSNGLAERAIRTMRDLISATLASGCVEKNWVQLLPRVEYTLNTTYQSATGCTPFEIVYGRKSNLHSTLKQNNETREIIADSAKEKATEACMRMKKQDIGARGQRNFFVGEEVLVRKEPHKRKKDGAQYDGPFRISKVLSPHQFELQCGNRNIQRRIEWLKR